MLAKFLFLQVWHMFGKGVHSLEYDAKVQYKFHQVAATIWFFAMILVAFFPALWSNSLGILIVLEVSLYANFATEFGSMSAAEAAMQLPSGSTTIMPEAAPGTIVPVTIRKK